MIINQTGEYALRALAYMASMAPQSAIRATDLSEVTGIPVHYLSKIMRRLVKVGIVSSQKGHGGGFAFAREPSAISFSDVLIAFDCITPPNRCAFGWGSCNPVRPCPLHPTWSTLKESFHEWAESSNFGQVGTWIPAPGSEPAKPGGSSKSKKKSKRIRRAGPAR